MARQLRGSGCATITEGSYRTGGRSLAAARPGPRPHRPATLRRALCPAQNDGPATPPSARRAREKAVAPLQRFVHQGPEAASLEVALDHPRDPGLGTGGSHWLDAGRHGAHERICEVTDECRDPALRRNAVAVEKGDERGVDGSETGIASRSRSPVNVPPYQARAIGIAHRMNPLLVTRAVVDHDLGTDRVQRGSDRVRWRDRVLE